MQIAERRQVNGSLLARLDPLLHCRDGVGGLDGAERRVPLEEHPAGSDGRARRRGVRTPWLASPTGYGRRLDENMSRAVNAAGCSAIRRRVT